MEYFINGRRQKFSIRKFSTGVASVLLSASLLFVSNSTSQVEAEEVDTQPASSLEQVEEAIEKDMPVYPDEATIGMNPEISTPPVNEEYVENTEDRGTWGMTQAVAGIAEGRGDLNGLPEEDKEIPNMPPIPEDPKETPDEPEEPECLNPDSVCTIESSVKEVSDQVDWNAKITFGDEGRFWHTEKVQNQDNPVHDHSKADRAKFYGPGDLEFNYYTFEPYVDEYGNKDFGMEIFRINFGTEYEIRNAIFKVKLPYTENIFKSQTSKEPVDNSTSDDRDTWGRPKLSSIIHIQPYYKFIKSNEGETEVKKNPHYLEPYFHDDEIDISFEDNAYIIKLGNIASRQAFSIYLVRVFESEEEYKTLPVSAGAQASVNLTGNYNFKHIDLPTTLEKKIWENYEGDLSEFGFDLNDLKIGEQREIIEEISRPSNDDVQNGYISKKKTSYTIKDIKPKLDDKGNFVLDESGNREYCYDVEYRVEYLKDFILQAEAVAQENRFSPTNENSLKKVINSNNTAVMDNDNDGVTDNLYLYGPGRMEIVTEQAGENESTTQQTWKFLFANEYAIENGKLTLTLPYEVTADEVSEIEGWRLSPYFPSNEDGSSNYIDFYNFDEFSDFYLTDRMTISGNKIEIDFSDIVMPSRIHFGIQVTKSFDTPQDFSKELKKATMDFKGQWYFKNMELPHKEEITEYTCPSCKICPPEDPTPEDPTPEDPTPEDPTPEDPTPEDPTPEDPTPEDPTPEKPTPEDPTPEDPTPEDPTPEDPTPENPTPKQTKPVQLSDNSKVVSASVSKANTLPATGENNSSIYGLAVLSLLTSLVMAIKAFLKRKEN